MYNRRRDTHNDLIKLKAQVIVEYDDQPIDMLVSPHMSTVATSPTMRTAA